MGESDQSWLEDIGWIRLPRKRKPVARERPLTDLQRRVLVGLLALETKEPHRYAWSANEIGYEIGAKTVTGGRGQGGRGSGRRVFGAGQQIIPTLTSMGQRGRGLVGGHSRDDGRSGGAFRLTEKGRAVAEELRSC